jgi:hypothetical protein
VAVEDGAREAGSGHDGIHGELGERALAQQVACGLEDPPPRLRERDARRTRRAVDMSRRAERPDRVRPRTLADVDRSEPQLALDVEPHMTVHVTERRIEAERRLAVGPLGESDARALVALLLSRPDPPEGTGPWRLPLAGGIREVALEAEDD